METIMELLKSASESLHLTRTQLDEVSQRQDVVHQQVRDLMDQCSLVSESLTQRKIAFALMLVEILSDIRGTVEVVINNGSSVYVLTKGNTTLSERSFRKGEPVKEQVNFGMHARATSPFWYLCQAMIDSIKKELKDSSQSSSWGSQKILDMIASLQPK
jgi:hypothetical protein